MTATPGHWWKSALLMFAGVTAAAQTTHEPGPSEPAMEEPAMEEPESDDFLEFLGEFGVADEWLDPMEFEKWAEKADDNATNPNAEYSKALNEQTQRERATVPNHTERSRWLMPDDATILDQPEDNADEET